MKYDIIIIGGGASGLCTAIMSKKDNNSILVIDHQDRVGKKILSTGNGKCNLTNSYCKVDLFESNPENIYPFYPYENREFAKAVINNFDCDDTIAFFESLGMVLENKNGYIYPRSEQASSVLEILKIKCIEKKIDLLLNYQPISITKNDDIFCIDNDYFCNKLVIATGGMSAPKTGSDGSGYEIAKSFGHTIVEPMPALCGIKCKDKFFKELHGVRNDSTLYLYEDDNLILSVFGNLQFNDYGISGIPVFQISSVAGRLLKEGRNLRIKIDLLPEIELDKLSNILDSKKDNRLLGVLNNKLGSVIEKEVNNKNIKCKDVSDGYVRACTIKRFKVHPFELNSFAESQVTSGGISVDEISPINCESKLIKNLFFTGEIIDINGICGGYNLQWAWSTAYAVSHKINI